MHQTTIQDSMLEPSLLDIYDNLKIKLSYKNSWDQLNEYQIWKELCFCILSGNVAFELVESVIHMLEKKEYLDYKWILRYKYSGDRICQFFSQPNFEPRKKDGGLRKYRYPQKRSEEIINAAQILYANSSIKKILNNSTSDIAVRNFLVNKIPGIGIKESSHFLRNIGYSNSLAIIDVHVLNFLKQYNYVDPIEVQTLTKLKYEKLEIILQNLAEFHKLDLNILDLAIWHYMRND